MNRPQLHMVWPASKKASPPPIAIPNRYRLRTCKAGDEARFIELMALVGWSDWDQDKLHTNLIKIVPDGWFMIIEEASDQIVATSMAFHNYKMAHPFWGHIGWIACDPAQRGHGLGRAVSAAATARLLQGGYTQIGLHTEDFRLPAIYIYLTLGYMPNLYLPEMHDRWETICHRLNLPFLPDLWRSEFDPTLGY